MGGEHRGGPSGPHAAGAGIPERPGRSALFDNARGDSPARGGERRGLQVTTPAEAGIAFLDGPRLGGYGAEIEAGEPEEAEPPAPAAAPEPRSEPVRPEPARETPRPAFAAAPAREEKAPEPAPAPPREETPEERERRLRASKTEIVEVGKAEGAPAKRGWWRR
jgi:hypothetical protein